MAKLDFVGARASIEWASGLVRAEFQDLLERGV